MDWLKLAVYSAVIAVNLTVGTRLLWKGRAPRARPEWLLGAAITLDGIEWLLWVLAYYSPATGTPVADFLGAGCRLGIISHNICLLAFTRLVFRPDSRVALAAVVGLALLMLTSWCVGIALGDWLGYRSDHIWIWLETGTEQVAYAWTCVEAGRHHLRMRRRLAHGLADPVIANRVLLWSLYGGSFLISGLFYMASIAVATHAGIYPFALDVAMIVFTCLSAGAIWLAFFPTSRYRSWVSGGRQLRFG